MGFEGMFGYNLNVGENDHLFKVKYVMASGDKDSADPDYDRTKIEAFNPMFQDYHMRYGLSDIFSFSNLTAMSLGWKMRAEGPLLRRGLLDVRTRPRTSYRSPRTPRPTWGARWTPIGSTSTTPTPSSWPASPTSCRATWSRTGTGGYSDAGMRLVGNLRLRF